MYISQLICGRISSTFASLNPFDRIYVKGYIYICMSFHISGKQLTDEMYTINIYIIIYPSISHIW